MQEEAGAQAEAARRSLEAAHADTSRLRAEAQHAQAQRDAAQRATAKHEVAQTADTALLKMLHHPHTMLSRGQRPVWGVVLHKGGWKR